MASTLRLPLAVMPENRGVTPDADSRLVNCFIEPVSRGQGEPADIWVYKRPGIRLLYQLPSESYGGKGIFNWNGDIYSVVGQNLYVNQTLVSSDLTTGAGGYSDRYSFSPILGSTPKLFFKTRSAAYVYTPGSGVVQVTDTDYPASTVPGLAYLDSTLYVGSQPTAIFGSGLNDPTSWDPLNVIQAAIDQEPIVAVSKQLVYVVVFKQYSVEIFYDAGNPTGSPLGMVQGAKVSVGCAADTSIQEIEGALYWVARARTGGVSIFAMDNLKAVQISTPAIDRLIEKCNFANCASWTAKILGHKFYVVSFPLDGLTLAFDATSSTWARWTDATGGALQIRGSTYSSTGEVILQGADGSVYVFDDTYYLDDTLQGGAGGLLFPVDIYTPNFDGGTKKRKFLKSMDIVADQTPGNSITIRKSDDDYRTWSQPRKVDLGVMRPRLTSLGTFRRRAFHIHHSSPYPLRLKALELDLELGTL